MRTLYLCRHAKSSWTDPGMADFDRPLNERGKRNAPLMAELFIKRNEHVQMIVSSTANRALATARIFSKALNIDEAAIIKEPRIYEASVKTLLEMINGLPKEKDHVMMFGHNPGFSNLIDHLTGESLGNLPTCGIARMDLLVDDWQAVSKGMGILAWLDYPKQFELE